MRPEPFTLVATYLKSTQRLRKLHIIRLFALTQVTITGSRTRINSKVSVSDGHALIQYLGTLSYGAKFTVMLIGR